MNTHNQTITGPTVLDIPAGQKLRIESDHEFVAATLPRDNAGSRMIDEMLSNGTPVRSYTTSNLSTVDSICVVSPVMNGSIPARVTPIASGMANSASRVVRPVRPRAPPVTNYKAASGRAYPVAARPTPTYASGRAYPVAARPTPNYAAPMRADAGTNPIADFWAMIPSWGHYIIYAVLAILVIALIWWLWKKYGSGMGASRTSSSSSSSWSLPSFF